MRLLALSVLVYGIASVRAAGDDPQPTTAGPTTAAPATSVPTGSPTTSGPTAPPTILDPTSVPVTPGPTSTPTTSAPVTPGPTSPPTTSEPTPHPTFAPVNAPTSPRGMVCGETYSGDTRQAVSNYGEVSGDAIFIFTVMYTGEHAFLACDSTFDTMLKIYPYPVTGGFPVEGRTPMWYSCDDCGGCTTRTSIISGVTPGFSHLPLGRYLMVLEGYRRAEGNYTLKYECRTGSPTPAPTAPPTGFPTTTEPTLAPTISPTTSKPTTAPTAIPSTVPTMSPTLSPTNTTIVPPEAAKADRIDEWNGTTGMMVGFGLLAVCLVVALAYAIQPGEPNDDIGETWTHLDADGNKIQADGTVIIDVKTTKNSRTRVVANPVFAGGAAAATDDESEDEDEDFGGFDENEEDDDDGGYDV